jgi:hypothetical protein
LLSLFLLFSYKDNNVTRFSKIQTHLCINPQAIADACAPVVEQSFNTIKKGLERYRSGASESWMHYDDPTDGRRKWVRLDAVPDQYLRRIEHHYGTPELAYLQELLLDEALRRVLPDDAPFFLHQSFPSDKADQLAEACGWLRLAQSKWWAPRWNGKTAFMADAAQVIKVRDLYGFKVGNGRTYGRRLERWLKSQHESLVPGTVGNNNAAKVTELGLKRLIDLYASPQKPDFVTVANIYNREAEAYGWATLTEERVRQILSTPKMKQISFGHRHGTEVMRNEMERTIKRRRPSFADALWILDGTTVQLLYLENGKPRSDLYAYYVMDANSDAIIGYALGGSERSTLVQAALRDAVGNTMHLPHQLQYDNSSANKSAESSDLMKRLSRVAFPTAPYNGKAKSIERVQGAIEGCFLRYFANWKGGNITAKSQRTRANVDHIQQQIREKDMPTKAGAAAQLRLAIELWNNTKDKDGRTRLEKYHVEHSERREVDYLLLVDLFWVERKHQVIYSKDGLTIQVNGERITYEVERSRGLEDMEFRKQYLGERFTVKYDPDMLEYINLYKDGAWVATARQKYETAMALVDRAEGEGAVLAKALDDRREYLHWQRTEMEAIKEEVRNEGLPVLSAELVHKDAYNQLENDLTNELLGIIQERETKPKPKTAPAYALFGGDDADGSIIE